MLGAAAAKCVETLRQEGCDGQIIMVCQEPHNPYDRIKVTKVLDADGSKLQLRTDDFYKVVLWFNLYPSLTSCRRMSYTVTIIVFYLYNELFSYRRQ